MINEECQILASEVGKLRNRVNELIDERDGIKLNLEALKKNYALKDEWLKEWSRVAECLQVKLKRIQKEVEK